MRETIFNWILNQDKPVSIDTIATRFYPIRRTKIVDELVTLMLCDKIQMVENNRIIAKKEG